MRETTEHLHADGPRFTTRALRDLRVREVLEEVHREHFAVHRGQARQRTGDVLAHFGFGKMGVGFRNGRRRHTCGIRDPRRCTPRAPRFDLEDADEPRHEPLLRVPPTRIAQHGVPSFLHEIPSGRLVADLPPRDDEELVLGARQHLGQSLGILGVAPTKEERLQRLDLVRFPLHEWTPLGGPRPLHRTPNDVSSPRRKPADVKLGGQSV